MSDGVLRNQAGTTGQFTWARMYIDTVAEDTARRWSSLPADLPEYG
ncbi:hypothetical protein IEU95_04760 [Hoyosella rhizosphaerae]|nr:hypothetical protein [Hoyosella rhizosphaerae]MBN4926128.1 hypothetical protein [Hoyosella rhizosphaerae]